MHLCSLQYTRYMHSVNTRLIQLDEAALTAVTEKSVKAASHDHVTGHVA